MQHKFGLKCTERKKTSMEIQKAKKTNSLEKSNHFLRIRQRSQPRSQRTKPKAAEDQSQRPELCPYYGISHGPQSRGYCGHKPNWIL